MSFRFQTILVSPYAYTGVVASAAPMTFAAWVRPTSVANLTEIICISSADSGNYFTLRLNGNVLQAASRQANTRVASSSLNLVANTWYHVCAVFASTSSRSAYVNGGNKGSNGNASTPVVTGGETCLACLGGTGRTDYYQGDIAEATIWNVALSDAEVASLARGLEPTFFRSSNILAYLPLLCHSSTWNGTSEGGYLMDFRNATGWRLINGAIVTSLQAHPRMVYSKKGAMNKPPTSSYMQSWGMQNGQNLFGGALVS